MACLWAGLRRFPRANSSNSACKAGFSEESHGHPPYGETCGSVSKAGAPVTRRRARDLTPLPRRLRCERDQAPPSRRATVRSSPRCTGGACPPPDHARLAAGTGAVFPFLIAFALTHGVSHGVAAFRRAAALRVVPPLLLTRVPQALRRVRDLGGTRAWYTVTVVSKASTTTPRGQLAHPAARGQGAAAASTGTTQARASLVF